ncbi:hypothetical protein [Peribacillus frigoritolerans]
MDIMLGYMLKGFDLLTRRKNGGIIQEIFEAKKKKAGALTIIMILENK